jgi:lipopolysaccharide transport protein LptA
MIRPLSNNFTALVRMCATTMLVASSAVCRSGALETSADEVSIDVKGGVQTLRGNVIVVHDGRIFKAQKIVIRQDGNSIQEVMATGAVSLQDGETIMTATACRYAAHLVIFSGDVVVQNSEIGTARADRATYTTTTKKVEFTADGKVELVLNPGRETTLFHGK